MNRLTLIGWQWLGPYRIRLVFDDAEDPWGATVEVTVEARADDPVRLPAPEQRRRRRWWQR